MDPKVFGRFIAGIRKEKNMTQAELAGIIGVTDKAISRWERGVGFPDINTLQPLAEALGITVYELMNSEKFNMRDKNMPESKLIEIMDKAVEMSKENQRQERVSRWLAGGVMIAIAILIKLFSKSNVGGAVFIGGVAALAVSSLYFYVKNYDDKQSRKIYGSFMLLGTLLSIVLFWLVIEPDKIIWLVYSVFFLSVVLTYR